MEASRAWSEALAQATSILLGRSEQVAMLGDTKLGLDAPDLVPVNQLVEIPLSGDSAASATCTVLNEAGAPIDYPDVVQADDQYKARASFSSPGVYQVQVQSGGGSPIVQYVLADGRR